MPATAGRFRMPANNRVHSSAALQTHGIWQSAIGYDPYAPSETEKKATGQAGRQPENAYDSFQGLLALARLTSSNATETRGACKKCGRSGHLTFQCRHFLSLKDDLALLPETEKEKDNNGGEDKISAAEKEANSCSEEEDDSTDLTDSSEDSEMGRIIAERFGGTLGKRSSRVSVKKSRVSTEDDCGENDDAEERERKKHRRRRRGEEGRVSSRKLDKSRVSSEEEEDSENSERERRRRSRKRKSRASSKNSEKSRVSSDDECDDSNSEARRKLRKRKNRASSKEYKISRVSTHE